MMMNLILGLTMYPTVIILFFVFRNYGLSDHRLFFGVHLPGTWKASPEAEEMNRRYRKRMNYLLPPILLFPALAFLTDYVSIQFTIWMIWFLAALIVMELPYVLANREAMDLKASLMQEQVKTTAGSDLAYGKPLEDPSERSVDGGKPDMKEPEQISYYELSAVRRVKLFSFLLPMLLSFGACIFLLLAPSFLDLSGEIQTIYQMYFWCELTFALLTVTFYGIAIWMDRGREAVISRDSQINVAYNRARKNIWKNIWLWEAWVNTAMIVGIVLSICFFSLSGITFLLLTIVDVLVAMLLFAYGFRQLNQVEKLYGAKREEQLETDDDRFWIWGMFYCNPLDRRNTVEKRYGVGLTMNMARPLGKVMLAVAVLALAWIPFLCIYMMIGDFTPLKVTLEERQIVCTHIFRDYEIPLDEIEKVQLVTELPKRYKINGSADDRTEKGHFSGGGSGNLYEFLHPDRGLFLQIETGNRVYLISGENDEEMESIYQDILADNQLAE